MTALFAVLPGANDFFYPLDTEKMAQTLQMKMIKEENHLSASSRNSLRKFSGKKENEVLWGY